MPTDRSDFLRRGTIALDNLRELDRRISRIRTRSQRVRKTISAQPEQALARAIVLLGEYRSLVAFAFLNMGGSLFIATHCASRVGKESMAEALNTLGLKYLTHGVLENVPEPAETFQESLEALGVLPKRAKRKGRVAGKKRSRNSAA